MNSKRLTIALLVILVAPLVRAAGPASISPATPQIYDAKNKLIGAPIPYVPSLDTIDFTQESCFLFYFDCEVPAPPAMNTAVSVAMKYSGGGTFYLNIFEIPEGNPPYTSWFLPDILYYQLPGCTGQAYVDTHNLSYPQFAVLTTRMGAINGQFDYLYLSAMNPAVTEVNFHSVNYGYSCENFGGSNYLFNGVAVNPTGISMDLLYTPPFHIQ